MATARLEVWRAARLGVWRAARLMLVLLFMVLSPYLLPRVLFYTQPPKPQFASLSPSSLSPSPPLTLPSSSLTSLRPQTSSSNSSSPSPHKTTRHHPAYDRLCYKYHTNLHAENICCRTANFSGSVSMIHQCITKANAHPLKVLRGNTTSTGGVEVAGYYAAEGSDNTTVGGGNITEGGGNIIEGGGNATESGGRGPARSEHWAVFGDSHMRYLLASLLTRFRSPTLQYRFEEKDKWLSAAVLEAELHKKIRTKNIEVRDLGINFHLTYYWDPFLKILPEKLTEWEQQPHRSPTLVILAAALHWMLETQSVYQTFGPEAAVTLYRMHIRSFKDQLTRLAANTTIVFKLLDDIMETSIPYSEKAINTQSNYPLYNNAAMEALSGTGVIIWDSTVPLSRAYNVRCMTPPLLHTPPWHHWNCLDKAHVGYILVDQYADMIINDYCNKFLNLGPEFCV
ncbi:uncharacterized protein [Procambarus clarkii]|uniref:uncharacterized protein n=1 Tax=Procambarus clarkii TaxID=6728 RepID=UPI001E675A6A|nr:uncharacterized protein LOC123773610 [Procambarus clarkii]